MPDANDHSKYSQTLGQPYSLLSPDGPPVQLVFEAVEDVRTAGGYETFTLVF